MMKKVLAILVLWATRANAACSYSQNFGSSSGTITSSNLVENFAVDTQGATTCDVTCDGGTDTRLLLRYGNNPTSLVNDFDQTVSGCALTGSVIADSRETQLGISVESTNYQNLAIECTCTKTFDPSGVISDGCFSGSTTVQVQDRGDVLMKDLQVGDRVLTGKNTFEPIYSFGHLHEELEGKLYQIYTDQVSQKPLELTGDHLLFVQDDDQAIRADHVHVGDQLVKYSGETVEVTKIATVTKSGLYMPLTADGTIVVDGGIVASTYVSIQAYAPTTIERIASFYGLSEHLLSHWWLSPYRMMCMGISSKYCENNNAHNEDGILNWLLVGRKLAQFVEPLCFWVGIVLMGGPIFAFFAVLNLVEGLLGGAAWAPLVVATIALGVACSLSSRRRMEAMISKKMN